MKAPARTKELLLEPWTDSTAFITGAGSGIGRALALALSARGARVCVSDIDGDAALRVASECGDGASSVALDVRDADAVREAMGAFAVTAGRLDYVFNNAGIGMGGEVDEIPLAAWKLAIDVNVYGVLHGVLAAYPIMLRQGFGHIVNTASLAGLAPAPLLTPYALTKHAVVGLSSSLRIEAAARGVRVSALCPGMIETPILHKKDPQLVGIPWVPDARRYLTALGGPAYPVEKLAQEALQAVAANQAVIVIPGRARFGWRLGRLFPALIPKACEPAIAVERRARVAAGAPARPTAQADDAMRVPDPAP
jgi:NAD(P)-dependent dehydrogenase (short-subunit alcohol dehydrogenase family)